MISIADPGVVQGLAYALQLLLGAVFLVSVLPKLRRPAAFRETVAAYDLLPRLAPVAAPAVTAVEALLAVAFLTGWALLPALALAALTLAAFAAATTLNLRRGRDIACGCFGGADERISSRSLARLGLVATAVVALAALLASPEASATTASWLRSEGAGGLAYLLQAATVGAFLAIVATWLLTAPALAGLVRAVRDDGGS